MLERSLRASSWREQHSAAVILLNYGFGKPAQPIVGEDGQAVTFLHLVAMREIGERVVAELVVQQSGAGAQTAHGGNGAAPMIEQPPDAVVDLGAPARE
jgi:hypothetical protein